MITVGKADNVNINLVDVTGKLIKQYVQSVNMGANRIVLSLPPVTAGQYLLKISSVNNATITQKIVVE
jgi:hypothetical protein